MFRESTSPLACAYRPVPPLIALNQWVAGEESPWIVIGLPPGEGGPKLKVPSHSASPWLGPCPLAAKWHRTPPTPRVLWFFSTGPLTTNSVKPPEPFSIE